MVVRREVRLKSRAQEQSPEISPAVENNNPEVGDEDQVYEPSVGDKVEGNSNGDRQWGRSSCMHALDGRSQDQKIRRCILTRILQGFIVLRTVRNECLNSK